MLLISESLRNRLHDIFGTLGDRSKRWFRKAFGRLRKKERHDSGIDVGNTSIIMVTIKLVKSSIETEMVDFAMESSEKLFAVLQFVSKNLDIPLKCLSLCIQTKGVLVEATDEFLKLPVSQCEWLFPEMVILKRSSKQNHIFLRHELPAKYNGPRPSPFPVSLQAGTYTVKELYDILYKKLKPVLLRGPTPLMMHHPFQLMIRNAGSRRQELRLRDTVEVLNHEATELTLKWISEKHIKHFYNFAAEDKSPGDSLFARVSERDVFRMKP